MRIAVAATPDNERNFGLEGVGWRSSQQETCHKNQKNGVTADKITQWQIYAKFRLIETLAIGQFSLQNLNGTPRGGCQF